MEIKYLKIVLPPEGQAQPQPAQAERKFFPPWFAGAVGDSIQIAYQLSAQIDSALKRIVDICHLPPNARIRLLFDEFWVQNTRLGIGELLALPLDTFRQGQCFPHSVSGETQILSL